MRPDCHKSPTRASLGTASLSISSRFVLSCVDKLDSPVTLPPGRAKLAIRPAATGSPALGITMGMVVVESISSCRSIVAQFTNSDLATVEDVASCPTQFQQFIEGVDYRVHMLDDRVFASRIVCSDDDYRYSEHTRIETATLPDDVCERCVALNRKLGLQFSGIDLRRSEAGEWYCFEVNPSPGYTYFETDSRAIGQELAEFLRRA
jgi:RimK-like ATP-grasp domain